MTFGVGRLSKNLTERRGQIEALRELSKEVTGAGYTLRWKTINKRDLGPQTRPTHAVIETLEDYLAVIRRRTEFRAFQADVERIRHHLPKLEAWLRANPKEVLAHKGHWSDLIAVCQYFQQHPHPNLYIRELPIPVHTKFIEDKQRIVRHLLDELLPPEAINTGEADFHKRFGLKDTPPTVRARLLDAQLERRFALPLTDLSLPMHQADDLLRKHVQPHRVIIVENLINFLTLPAIEGTVSLFGAGFAVNRLRELAYLHQCEVIYWGDIDAYGFRILSDLRGIFPHVKSMMMDWQTLADNERYVVQGQQVTSQDAYAYLTAEERGLAEHVNREGISLEQEHIPHLYALAVMSEIETIL
jgi:hypothetical protein